MTQKHFLFFNIFLAGIVSSLTCQAQNVTTENPGDTIPWTELDDFVITKRKSGNFKLSGPENAFQINRTELFKAACCNLGESFTTNPSVDVNYSDPATGAKQIKLLGLSGSYVQMLTENLPNFRGAARPYALRYVPGPWMKSISVSKGASSVKNGYESMSGQIDVEYLKPDDPAGVTANAYIDSQLKIEANLDANFHLNQGLGTELLGPFEDSYMNHDSNNDGFTAPTDIR
ncbi:MAG: TonB-dependent receptor plug domain-containing protein, partial [Muribaculaceae bacterium]|nr:TonB-dependent receptor plug domain-containing protein [Muribaculaceae bacterium]